MASVLQSISNLGVGWFNDILSVRIYYDADLCDPLQTGTAGAPPVKTKEEIEEAKKHEAEDSDSEDEEGGATIYVSEVPLFVAGAAIQGFIRITAPPGRTVQHSGVKATLSSRVVSVDELMNLEVCKEEIELIPEGGIKDTIDLPFVFPGSISARLPDSYEGTLFSIRHQVTVTIGRPWYTFEVSRDAAFGIQRLFEVTPRCSYGLELASSGYTAADVLAERVEQQHPASHDGGDDAAAGEELADASKTGAGKSSAAASKDEAPLDLALQQQLALYGPQEAAITDMPDGSLVSFICDKGVYEQCEPLEGSLSFLGVATPIVLARLALVRVEYCNGQTNDELVWEESVVDARRWKERKRLLAKARAHKISESAAASAASQGKREASAVAPSGNGNGNGVVKKRAQGSSRASKSREEMENEDGASGNGSGRGAAAAAAARAAVVPVTPAPRAAKDAPAAAAAAPGATGSTATSTPVDPSGKRSSVTKIQIGSDGSKHPKRAVIVDSSDAAAANDNDDGDDDDDSTDGARKEADNAGLLNANDDEDEDEDEEDYDDGVESDERELAAFEERDPIPSRPPGRRKKGKKGKRTGNGDEGEEEDEDAEFGEDDERAWYPDAEDLAGFSGDGSELDPDLPLIGDVTLSVDLDFNQILGLLPTMAYKIPRRKSKSKGKEGAEGKAAAGQDDDDDDDDGSYYVEPESLEDLETTKDTSIGEDVSVRYFLRLTVYSGSFAAANKRWASRELVITRERLYGQRINPGLVSHPQDKYLYGPNAATYLKSRADSAAAAAAQRGKSGSTSSGKAAGPTAVAIGGTPISAAKVKIMPIPSSANGAAVAQMQAGASSPMLHPSTDTSPSARAFQLPKESPGRGVSAGSGTVKLSSSPIAKTFGAAPGSPSSTSTGMGANFAIAAASPRLPAGNAGANNSLTSSPGNGYSLGGSPAGAAGARGGVSAGNRSRVPSSPAAPQNTGAPVGSSSSPRIPALDISAEDGNLDSLESGMGTPALERRLFAGAPSGAVPVGTARSVSDAGSALDDV